MCQEVSTFDIISIFISGIAIILSLITLYFSFFYRKTSLTGAFVLYDQEGSEVFFEYTFSNTGNRELLIKDILIDYCDIKEDDLVPIFRTEQLPLILKPGQMSLVKFSIPIRFFNWVKEREGNFVNTFSVISSNGKSYLPFHIIKFSYDDKTIFEIKPETWHPFSGVKKHKLKF